MKYLKYIGALFVFVVGCMYASNSRRNKQRSEAITDREINELSKGKQTNLKKAAKLGTQAEVKLERSATAKANAEAAAVKLEESDATSLADRMRRFNNSL